MFKFFNDKKKKLYINCSAIWKADFPSDFSNMDLHFSKSITVSPSNKNDNYKHLIINELKK